LVHDRLLGFGDDHWIEDDRGARAFLVDGKAMRLRDTWELKDTSGRVLVGIRQAMFALRDTMVLERAGERLATVRRE
ncbi:LURP-one-related family protein, partial [Streptomyces sp. TRM76130]|nr:LURP-one-related family protein [Streptomyces sp. TRM76130]